MGTYMKVILKKNCQNDSFIQKLNEELTNRFGSNTGIKFNSWEYLEEEADYFNTHPEGTIQMPHIPKPITKEYLEQNFFWYRYGHFWFKLSGGGTNSDECRDAVAVCKWIIETKRKYIDQANSENYQSAIVKDYLNNYFEEAGYDLTEIWKLPNDSNIQ